MMEYIIVMHKRLITVLVIRRLCVNIFMTVQSRRPGKSLLSLMQQIKGCALLCQQELSLFALRQCMEVIQLPAGRELAGEALRLVRRVQEYKDGFLFAAAQVSKRAAVLFCIKEFYARMVLRH